MTGRPESLDGLEAADLGRGARSFQFRAEDADEEDRTIPISFSSERVAERWWGNEILDHGGASMRTERLAAGAPLLWQHNADDQIGIVEDFHIDAGRVGRAVVRFARGGRAEELYRMVLDGIVRNVSVGYLIHEMRLEVSRDDGPDDYRVTDWEPLEISMVSVPMDPSVGVGREIAAGIETRIHRPAPEPGAKTAADAATESSEEDTQGTMSKTAPPAPPSAEEIQVIQREGQQLERTRQAEIREITKRQAEAHPDRAAHLTALADAAVNSETTVSEFRGQLLEVLGTPAPIKKEELGLSKKEKEGFSVLRLLQAVTMPEERSFREAAAFELEVSREARNLYGSSNGALTLPPDILLAPIVSGGEEVRAKVAERLYGHRDMAVGTPALGGNLVAQELLAGSFIEYLRASRPILGMATILDGLVGDIFIPRQSGTTTAYHLVEGADATASDLTIDQVAMKPTTIAGRTEVNRRLMIQSTPAVEAMIRMDLFDTILEGIERQLISGDGTANTPVGVLNRTGIGSVVAGPNGADPTWSHVVFLKREVAKDNALRGRLAYVGNPDVTAKLQTTARFSGGEIPIMGEDGDRLAGYPYLESTVIPSDGTKGTGTNLSTCLFGNWADVLVGLWGGLDMMADPYSNSQSGVTRIVVFQDYDTEQRHAESIAAVSDWTTD